MTPDEIARSRELYESGMSLVEVGGVVGKSNQAVWRALKKAGVQMRSSGAPRLFPPGEAQRQGSKRWKKRNPEKVREQWARHNTSEARRVREARMRAENRQRVLAHYGPACRCCGEAHEAFLTIDHIDGCSPEERKTQGQGSAFYRWLIKSGFPEGFQVLCFNCNNAKRIHGVCPHQTKLEVVGA